MAASTCVSAPGKVLLAGGYLVLDRAHSGVVVSTSARFYAVIRPGGGAQHVRVRSPQFVAGEWTYAVDAGARPLAVARQGSAGRNKFVELAIQRTLALAAEIRGAAAIRDVLAPGLDIAIVGANDFYSQRAALASRGLPATRAALASLPAFLPSGTTLAGVHKTGLGSSAALITALVGALLVHTGALPGLARDADRRLAHHLAQHVHCLAQGKVGSGFDVAAAVFGSHLYTRFAPAVLAPLMADVPPSGAELAKALAPGNAAWDYVVQPFGLPPRVRLLLADVDAGSDTPSLVGQVLKWRAAQKAEADALWAELDVANSALARALSTLCDLHATNSQSYDAALAALAPLPAAEWARAHPSAVTDALLAAHAAALAIRAHMRDMSVRTGVPIEPPAQTALLDACGALAGVLGGGVPGAGGYDALWVLVLDAPGASAADAVERVWTGWTDMRVAPLLAEASVQAGCRVEDVAAVPGLAAAIGF